MNDVLAIKNTPAVTHTVLDCRETEIDSLL